MKFNNPEELSLYFKKSIERESKAEIDELTKEISGMTEEARKLFQKELEEEKLDILAAKARDIYKQYQEDLSVKQRTLDLLVMEKRMHLIDQLFLELRKRIEAFRLTKDYNKWFQKKLSRYNIKDFETIEINELDKNLVPSGLDIIMNPEIKAGFILHSKNLSAVVVETISSNLEEARKYFYQEANWFSE